MFIPWMGILWLNGLPNFPIYLAVLVGDTVEEAVAMAIAITRESTLQLQCN